MSAGPSVTIETDKEDKEESLLGQLSERFTSAFQTTSSVVGGTGEAVKRATASGSKAVLQAAQLESLKDPLGRSKSLTYDPHLLSTWRTFLMFRGTVFMDPSIRWSIVKLLCVATATGLTLFLCVPNPEKLSTQTFSNAINFIKVFIAFMLGLYLNSCLARWYNILGAVTDMFMAVKKVVWSLNSCGVEVESREKIQKLLILSCYLLEGEVANQWENSEDQKRRHWEDTAFVAKQKGVLTDAQKRVLESKVQHGSRSLAVYAWVGTLVRSLKGPGISPPMLGRIASECAEAIEQLKKIKTYGQLQLPFMYSHMLACLVQINNILLAISCGFACSVRVGFLIHAIDTIFHPNPYQGGVKNAWVEVANQLQGLFIELMVVIIEPVLYQAFLIIASTLADPFTHDEYGLPMLEYIEELSDQLNEMNAFAQHKPDMTPLAARYWAGDSPQAKKYAADKSRMGSDNV